ncbi:MAG: hypothetical protein F6J95_033315 [Leptolyngbya sp. SIO1E4]|nr:hypothetical protein [Leptolyngbya sp. SIO1E4]
MSINKETFGNSLQLSGPMEFIGISQEQADRTEKIRKEIVTDLSLSNLADGLEKHLDYLRDWSPHYDFEFWDKIESQFEYMWPNLSKLLYLGVEYGLYEGVRDIFFEIRNLLQWTGLVKERIYFSAWLKRESINKQDEGTTYISVSSLAWSFTSSGFHQDLGQANALLKDLDSFIDAVENSSSRNSLKSNIIDSLGKDLYSELMMDAHENGVRISIRNQDLKNAKYYIERGRNKINSLFSEDLILPRLEERFMLAFRYHEGIVFFLQEEYAEAEAIFSEILQRASLIGWDRVTSGAHSWLATLAIELGKYDKCEDILSGLIRDNLISPHKRDGICQLIKAQLLDKIGHKGEKAVAEERAAKVFREISGEENNPASRCNLTSFVLSPH